MGLTVNLLGSANTWQQPQTWPGGAYIEKFDGATWLSLPTTGPSGVGVGPSGDNVMLGYVYSTGQWFTNSHGGEIAIRNNVNVRLGVGTGAQSASVNIGTMSVDFLLPESHAQSLGTTTSSGAVTITAAQMAAGYFADSATQTADYTLTTDTAANILSAFPNVLVGSSIKMRLINNDQSATGYSMTLAGGSGVTISTSLPNPSVAKGSYADYLFTFTAIGSSPALSVVCVGTGSL